MAQPDNCPSKLQEVNVAISSATTTAIVAAPGAEPTYAVKVWMMIISCATAQDITIKDGTTTLQVFQSFAGTMILPFNRYPWFTCSTNAALNVTTSSTPATSIRCYYTNTPVSV